MRDSGARLGTVSGGFLEYSGLFARSARRGASAVLLSYQITAAGISARRLKSHPRHERSGPTSAGGRGRTSRETKWNPFWWSTTRRWCRLTPGGVSVPQPPPRLGSRSGWVPSGLLQRIAWTRASWAREAWRGYRRRPAPASSPRRSSVPEPHDSGTSSAASDPVIYRALVSGVRPGFSEQPARGSANRCEGRTLTTTFRFSGSQQSPKPDSRSLRTVKGVMDVF